MEFHKLANIFPILEGEKLEKLAENIKENGLLENIYTYENKILDGRNRWNACNILGMKPKFTEYKGNDPLGFVLSLNLHRRHLNESQRAVIAEKIANMKSGKRTDLKPSPNSDEVSLKSAAQLLNVSRSNVADIRLIKNKSPESIKDIESGKKTIHEIKKEIRKENNISKENEKLKTITNEKQWIVTDNQNVVKCDVVITDPPYGILNETWDTFKDIKDLRNFTCNWISNWNDSNADFIIFFWSQRFLIDVIDWAKISLSNYDLQQILIWHYPNNKSPQSRMMFKQTYEPILFYRKRKCERKIGVSGSEWGTGLNDFDCHVAAVPQSNFNDSEMKQHPAQKPVSVMKWLINATTEIGELVCDPFCGSGTTGIASIALKRKFHGIEINPEFIELSNRRIATYGIQ
jgi:DNA modification methylase